MVFALLLTLYVFLVASRADREFPRGHLQPLGSHQPSEGSIRELDAIPSSETFYNDFIHSSRPVLLRNALRSSFPLEKWTDDYLKIRHGDAVVRVDFSKQENRDLHARPYVFSDFLEEYNRSEFYLIDTLPDSMQEEFPLLSCLSCGGFLTTFQDFGMWFSSGGTKSSFHFDTVENLNCQVSGTKEWIFINKTVPGFHDVIDHMEGDFSSVNVDAVDMIEFPQFQNVPWWTAVTRPGDCVYVPYKWFHYVKSLERNLAVNIWWTPFDRFNRSDCQNGEKNVLTLSDCHFTPGSQIRFYVAEMIGRHKGERMTFEEMHPLLIHEHTGKRLLNVQGFSALDVDENGYLTRDEVNGVSVEIFEQHIEAPPGEINTYGASGKMEDDDDEPMNLSHNEL
ncbi:tRNA wybutosine-synthesizing protein 5-like isoform X2 [Oscarella lobularis]|uniref:tRNA wybutosine-synthesizing protein 5-like isoform X2 n=1 Tax=Oscarella lobularis TaxID=121494 RepID=UPI0033136677